MGVVNSIAEEFGNKGDQMGRGMKTVYTRSILDIASGCDIFKAHGRFYKHEAVPAFSDGGGG